MPAKLLRHDFSRLSLAAKREFVTTQIEAHASGGLLVFSKTY